jgi:hypothetical protein
MEPWVIEKVFEPAIVWAHDDNPDFEFGEIVKIEYK